MGKLDSILSLISLIANRDVVTLQNIMDTLKISRATAFRYIAAISEANFPVYFDKDLGGYCFNTRRVRPVPPLDATSTVLTLAALTSLSKRLRGHYNEMIKSIESRILSQTEMPIEETLSQYRSRLEGDIGDKELSDVITTLLIEVAIANGRRIKLSCSTDGAPATEKVVDNPALWFDNGWAVVGRNPGNVTKSPVAEIERIRIL